MSMQNIDQILNNITQEIKLSGLITRGCLEHRWAIGEEERSICEAIVYNAFEAFAIQAGMTVQDAERFCDDHLELLMQRVLEELD